MKMSVLPPFARLVPALCAFACGCTLGGASEPAVKVSVWRGETAYVEIRPGLLKNADGRRGPVEVEGYRCDPVAYASKIKGKTDSKSNDLMVPEEESPTVLRVSAQTGAKPGRYRIGDVEVEVSRRALPPPAEWKYFLDLWQHPWAVARFHGLKPFSKEHYAAMRPVWKTLADCGQKALTVTLLDLPWNHQCHDGYESMIGRVKLDDGTWRFDYSLFDEYVKFGRECGIGPDIACYTMCPWGNVVRWKNAKGEVVKQKAPAGSREFKEYWGAFLVDFAKHLKRKGWFENTYIAMDERSPKEVLAIANFVEEKAPGLKIAMAGNRKPSSFKGIHIDNYCQALRHLTDDFLPELAKRRAQGFRTTYYVCCSPARPNTFMYSPTKEAYWLGAYAAISGFDGFLRWAANSWPADPYKDATFGPWASGDTYLVYPKGELSLRLAALRAGIVAAEKLRILREAGEFSAAEAASLASRYGYADALKGKLDLDAFRAEIEKILAR